MNRKAIGQTLHYAQATGRNPAVAFFILHQQTENREKLKYVAWLCRYYKIKVWFINDDLANGCKNQLKELHVNF